MKTRIFRLLMLVLGLSLLVACTPGEEPTPAPTVTPTATPTRMPAAPNNQYVDALNSAQAKLRDVVYGLGPLLREDETRIVVEPGPEGDFAQLLYPPQPEDPAEWLSMDSFVFAYAAREALLDSPHVTQVALGNFDVAAPLENLEDQVAHTAVWARFTDGSQAIVDLTPLATNFGTQHSATELLTDPRQIQNRFEQWRNGVRFDRLQPMRVVNEGGEVYYLLAEVLVTPTDYEFALHAYVAQTGTPIRPFRLTRGALAKIAVARAEFEPLQARVAALDEDGLADEAELVERAGNDDPALNAVLDTHLHLLWHMVTKLEQSQPSGQNPQGTPLPTATPAPSPTATGTPLPTATPTKPRLPLQVS